MKVDGSLAVADLGSCRSIAGPEPLLKGATDMKANESFGLKGLRAAMTIPLWGNQMPLTYFRKIVALTIVVVVDRRMFVDQLG